MTVEFEHPDYAATQNYQVDWALTSAPGTVVHTQTIARVSWDPVPSTSPQRYRRNSFSKPSPMTGPYVISITAINAAGASAPVTSASFSVAPPGPVANITVTDAHI